MASEMTIGRLARAADVPTTTVRYYERIGLLAPAGRTSSNYRFYGDGALERLRFIRAAQSNGFTLDDVATLLAFRDRPDSVCGDVQKLIERRAADLERRIAELHDLRRTLTTILEECRKSQPNGACQAIDRLERVSTDASI
jgi:MerR family mercuric resistance operon transcriptional regulator